MCRRKIDNRALTVGASGWTYFTRAVLWDRETESLWYLLDKTTGATCISGVYADRKLGEIFSSRKTTLYWKDWKAVHPNSKFMKY